MARRVVRLTPDHLSTLPQEAAARLRWKVDAVTLARTPADARAAEVRLWVSEVLREWGSCGRVVLWDDEPVGVAVHAPPAFLPGLGELPTAPPSPDAVVLADLFVAPHARNAGVGRMLVQAVASDLVGREVRALEAFGSTSARAEEEGMLPADFLGAVGFHTHRPHVTTPRMRIDMRSTRTWRSEVEQALGKLVGVVRPKKSPVPTPMQSDGSGRGVTPPEMPEGPTPPSARRTAPAPQDRAWGAGLR